MVRHGNEKERKKDWEMTNIWFWLVLLFCLVLLDYLLSLTLRNFIKLPVLRYLSIYNVVYICGVSGPSLLIESTDSWCTFAWYCIAMILYIVHLCLSTFRWHSFNRNQPSDTCTEVSWKWIAIIVRTSRLFYLLLLLVPFPIQSAELDSLYAVPIENKHNQEYVSLSNISQVSGM